MTGMMLLLLGSAVYTVLVLGRYFGRIWDGRQGGPYRRLNAGKSQTTGTREFQSDRAGVLENRAGTLAVLADGIGRSNTGMVCAQIAVDTVLDQFEPYQGLNAPEYFFQTAFYEANRRIQQTIGERRGGAAMGAVFMDADRLHYAVAGDIKIALLRGDEIIPLSRGQTLDVLALQAFDEGKISRQDAVFSMDEKRIWNYLGQDGFREIELCDPPVQLKRGDKVLLMSRGIFEVLSWRELEDLLIQPAPMQELADRIVMEADRREGTDRENGSVILLQWGGINETEQF